jgi:hypothetical protein
MREPLGRPIPVQDYELWLLWHQTGLASRELEAERNSQTPSSRPHRLRFSAFVGTETPRWVRLPERMRLNLAVRQEWSTVVPARLSYIGRPRQFSLCEYTRL